LPKQFFLPGSTLFWQCLQEIRISLNPGKKLKAGPTKNFTCPGDSMEKMDRLSTLKLITLAEKSIF
jgi:hypothetical protein